MFLTFLALSFIVWVVCVLRIAFFLCTSSSPGLTARSSVDTAIPALLVLTLPAFLPLFWPGLGQYWDEVLVPEMLVLLLIAGGIAVMFLMNKIRPPLVQCNKIAAIGSFSGAVFMFMFLSAMDI